MSLIPQDFIDEVISRTDIVEVVNSRVVLKKAGGTYKACCPFHDEKTPSFNVNQNKQFYHCFGCGVGGSVVGFLMDHDHLSFVEAIETLAELNSLEIPKENQYNNKRQDDLKPIYSALEDADKLFRNELTKNNTAKSYLKNRGITGITAKAFGIGYAKDSWSNLLNHLKTKHLEKTLHAAGLLSTSEKNDVERAYDKFRDRIMFPIRDRRGRPIAFGGRIMGDGEPKYLNSPETKVFHKSNTLYGLFEARQHPGRIDSILVVEGYMDCVALAQYGITNVVATLGTAVTKEHMQQLMRLVKNVVICFDGDKAGRKAAKRALERSIHVLKDGMQIDFMFLPDGEDPDSMVQKIGADEFKNLIDQATPLSSYLMQVLQAEHSNESAEGRTLIAMEARELLEPLNTKQAKLLKKQLTDEIFEITKIDLNELEEDKKPKASNRPSRVRSHNRERKLEMNAMDQTIAIILQQPDSARLISDDLLVKLHPLQNGSLLAEIIDICREQPTINNAILLENFRETNHFLFLQQLSAWSPPPTDQLETDDQGNALDTNMHFKDLLKSSLNQLIKEVTKKYTEKRFIELEKKYANDTISAEEKNELVQLTHLMKGRA